MNGFQIKQGTHVYGTVDNADLLTAFAKACILTAQSGTATTIVSDGEVIVRIRACGALYQAIDRDELLNEFRRMTMAAIGKNRVAQDKASTDRTPIERDRTR